MARKSDTDSVMRFTIGVVLFLPIAAFILLKLLLHGIVWLLTAAGEPKKSVTRKPPASAVQTKVQPLAFFQRRMESSTPNNIESVPSDPWDEDDSDDWDEDEDDLDDWDEEDDWEAEEAYENVPARSGTGAGLENIAQRKDDPEMATIIGAGKYVFGEDLPLGKYDLKVVSGNGGLTIRYGETEDDENWISMGTDADHAREYRNLSLEQGRYFMIDDSLRVEITRSKMLKIDP